MKKNEIEVGVTYHNGKTGNRSYSARKVIELGTTYRDWYQGILHDGVTYEQIAGPYKGQTCTLSSKAFAAWAKGRVGEETENA